MAMTKIRLYCERLMVGDEALEGVALKAETTVEGGLDAAGL
jgi:hypothetical protein